VNRHLLDMNEATMFVTAVYGVLNRRTREFVYVRAGHDLPIVLDARGELIAQDPGHGQLLGVSADPVLEEQTTVVPSSGTLLLYTDGVTEANDAQGAFFELERLQDALRAHRHAPAQALCDQLVQVVMEYQGAAPQHDDLALVAVQAK
jgi:sigma-B regulation protein RsbU (phosphoserine phosphatase)